MLPTFPFFPKGTILLLLLVLLLSFSSLSAKSDWVAPPLSVVEEGSAPEINMAFSYGTENDPVPAASSISMVYAYTDYSIDEAESNITVDLQSSWYGNASQVSVSYTIDHEARMVYVTLTRNDNQEIEGFGFMMRLKGIIIVIDEVERIGNPNEDFTVNAYFSSDTETLLLDISNDFGPLKFSLFGLNGALIAQKRMEGGTQGKWHLGNIVPQIYVLEMANETMVFRKKIAIGR